MTLKNGLSVDCSEFKISSYSYNNVWNFHDFYIPRKDIHMFIEHATKTIPIEYLYISGTYRNSVRVWIHEEPYQRHAKEIQDFLWKSLDGRTHDYFSDDFADFLWNTKEFSGYAVWEDHDHIVVSSYHNKNLFDVLKTAPFYNLFVSINYSKGKYSEKQYISELYYAPTEKSKRKFKLKTIDDKNWLKTRVADELGR